MTLQSGARLGPYLVMARIGAGGMGEVYLATDTKLGRDVAIKVLPAEVARDTERLARFEREARTLASLNHPNIATVHGLEDDDETAALVMEFIEGQTLADRIATGPIPLREALAIARQIADALEVAHDRGIAHRDLKPGNVMIRPDGTAKVLDFGLAKDVRAASESNAPTVTAVTSSSTGGALGTPAYMSPEQARGEPLDRRTDIWAFGCVLFEMLSGKRAFGGSSTSETIGHVLTAEVDWSALPRKVPVAVRHLMTRCLDRDARRRLRDIGEARLILEDAAAPHAPAGIDHEIQPWRRRQVLVLLVPTLMLGILLGSLGVWRVIGTTEPPRVIRTSIPLAEGQNFTYPGRRYIALSPTGTHVAYTAGPGLWIRALADLEARLVPGADRDPRSPFFSPDGQSLGYYAAGALWRVSVFGGAPTQLVMAVNPWGVSWGADGTIVYGQGPDGVWRVSDTGGEATRIVEASAGESMYGPQLLPGAEWVLFTLLPRGVGLWDQARLVVQSLSTGERVTVVNGARDGRYLPTGHLLYASRDTLLALPFDPGTRKPGAAPVPLVEGVADASNITAAAQFDVAETGELVYVPRSVPDRLELTWVDRNGREERVPSEARAYRHPRVSPDGQRLAVEVRESYDSDIWIGDRRGTFTRLTNEDGEDGFPVWSPDGLRVVFFSARSGGGLFARSPGGASDEQLLARGAEWRPSTWTADGRLVYEQLRGAQIEIVGTEPGDRPESATLVNDPAYFDILHPAISPDGRWLAYQSIESGPSEVYVRRFPVIDGDKRLVSAGGYYPVWSPDGRELFYIESLGQTTRPARTPDSRLMAVQIRTQPALTSSSPTPLFSLRDYVSPSAEARNYDIGPDGRFLMLKDVTPGGSRIGDQIVLVQHWLAELQARVHASP